MFVPTKFNAGSEIGDENNTLELIFCDHTKCYVLLCKAWKIVERSIVFLFKKMRMLSAIVQCTVFLPGHQLVFCEPSGFPTSCDSLLHNLLSALHITTIDVQVFLARSSNSSFHTSRSQHRGFSAHNTCLWSVLVPIQGSVFFSYES